LDFGTLNVKLSGKSLIVSVINNFCLDVQHFGQLYCEKGDYLKPIDKSRPAREVKFKDETCYKCKSTGDLAF
jgi:hypothetical protein